MLECVAARSRVCAAPDNGVVDKKAGSPSGSPRSPRSPRSTQQKIDVEALHRRLEAFETSCVDSFHHHQAELAELREKLEATHPALTSPATSPAMSPAVDTQGIEQLRLQMQKLVEEQELQRELLNKVVNSNPEDKVVSIDNLQEIDNMPGSEDKSELKQQSPRSREEKEQERVSIATLEAAVLSGQRHIEELETRVHAIDEKLRLRVWEESRELANQEPFFGKPEEPTTFGKVMESDEEQHKEHYAKLTRMNTGIMNLQPEPMRELQETVWEVCIFIGLGVGVAPAILAVLAVVLNAYAQILFCAIVQSSLTDRMMPSASVMEYWRTQAHDVKNIDPVTGMSLVARVCGFDQSISIGTSSRTLLENAENYTDGLFPYKVGPVLFLLAWFLWFLCSFQEVVQILDFMQALVAIPRGPTKLSVGKEGFALVSISVVFMLGMLALQVLRAAVSVSLFINGSIWLANKLDLEDLLLNASALSFILDLDELLFCAAIPAVMQNMLKTFEPLRMPQYNTGCFGRFMTRFGFRPFVFIVAAAASGTFLFMQFAWENVQDLETLSKVVCSGNKDFVYLTSVHGIIAAKPTTPYSETFAEEPLPPGKQATYRKAAKELWTRTTDVHQPEWIAWFVPETIFTEFQTKTSDGLNQIKGIVKSDCKTDDLWGEGEPRFAVNALERATGVTSSKGCIDFVPHCGKPEQDFLRLSCPNQCGCDNPISGLYFGGEARGCPRQHCQGSDNFVDKMMQLQCADTQPFDWLLPEWEVGWARFWDEFEQGDPGFYSNAAEIVAGAKLYKCDIFLHEPYLVEGFCRETKDVSPLTSFCPLACGCLANPHLKGCPWSCRIHDVRYQEALSELPCSNVNAGFLSIPIYSNFLNLLLQRYNGSATGAQFFKENGKDLPWELGINLPYQLVSLIVGNLNTNGCGAIAPESLLEWCSVDVVGFRAFCPEACYCATFPTIGCSYQCFGTE